MAFINALLWTCFRLWEYIPFCTYQCYFTSFSENSSCISLWIFKLNALFLSLSIFDLFFTFKEKLIYFVKVDLMCFGYIGEQLLSLKVCFRVYLGKFILNLCNKISYVAKCIWSNLQEKLFFFVTSIWH